MNVASLGLDEKNSSTVNRLMGNMSFHGITHLKEDFQKYDKELRIASACLKKVPKPEAQILAKCIDAGLIIFNSKDGNIDDKEAAKLVTNTNDLLNASGIISSNMSGEKIFANKTIEGLKKGSNYDNAEKGAIGFMAGKWGFLVTN